MEFACLNCPDMNWSDKSWGIMMHIFWKSDQTHLSPLVIPKGEGEYANGKGESRKSGNRSEERSIKVK